MRLSKKIALVALATMGAAGAASAASAAFADWTTTGSGTGASASGALKTTIVVNQTSTIAGLYPGGPPQTLAGNFDQPDRGKAYIANVTGSLTSVTEAPGADSAKPTCTVADFTLGGTAPVNQEVNSGPNQGGWSGLTIALKDTAANQDNCQDATVNIAYAANAS